MFARRTAGQRDPAIPAGVTGDGLDREVLAELKGLGRGLAADVGAHLAAVALFINDDPERAWEHAVAARRMAARLGVVRETAGLAAYRAGRYTDALAELRTARRMTGSNVHLPVMADSERGLGRPERALEIIRGEEAESLGRDGRIELAIVESGARTDLGQLEAAVVAVQLPELDAKDSIAVARLRFAYAEALRAVGQGEQGDIWHRRALAADRDGLAGIPVVVVGNRSEYSADEYIEDDEYEDDDIIDLEFDEDDDEDAASDAGDLGDVDQPLAGPDGGGATAGGATAGGTRADDTDDRHDVEVDDVEVDEDGAEVIGGTFSEPIVAEPISPSGAAPAQALFAEPEPQPAPGGDPDAGPDGEPERDGEPDAGAQPGRDRTERGS